MACYLAIIGLTSYMYIIIIISSVTNCVVTSEENGSHCSVESHLKLGKNDMVDSCITKQFCLNKALAKQS